MSTYSSIISMPPRPRRLLSGVLVSGLAASALTGVAVAASAAAAEAPVCAISGDLAWVECTQVFAFTGGEQQWDIPDGVTSIDVVAVGANGADGSFTVPPEDKAVGKGGRGAVVEYDGLVLPAGTETVYVEVGGSPLEQYDGGFNGGGNSQVNPAGAGGGASDIRTVSRAQEGTLESRVLVAGGGGGAGGAQIDGVDPSPDGGDADHAAPNMIVMDTASPAVGWVIGGGGAGGASGGGAGGTVTPGLTHVYSLAGFAGSFGDGADAPAPRDASISGGGGGGWYGGGSGSAASNWTFLDSATGFGAGGGGGSSYPVDATIGVNTDGAAPSVTVSWREPLTLTVTAPATVGTNEEFAVSATIQSPSLSAQDVTSSTLFGILPGEGGSCTGAVCVATAGGQITVTGTYNTLGGSAPVTVGTAATIDGQPPAAQLNQAYSFTYAVTGDPAPTLTVTDGDLPAGLTLQQDGTLAGTPTEAGTYSFTITADNGFDPPAVVESTLQVAYAFEGFFSPVDMPPAVNTLKAGSALPVKFSLGGDYGLDIFADGDPTFVAISCTPAAEDPAPTVTAAQSKLNYDPTTDTYNYVWKTSKSDADKCGQFQMTLNDGTTHILLIKFK